MSHTSHQSHRQASKRAAPFLLFRLLLGGGSAIIRPVSRKAILGTLIFDIGGGRKIAAVGPKGQNLLPLWHTSTAKKEPGNPDKDLGSVRNLAYLALIENDQNSRTSRICETRHVVNSAWRVFCPCLFKALGRASVKTGILGTPRSFRAKRGCVQQKARKGRSENGKRSDMHGGGIYVVHWVFCGGSVVERENSAALSVEREGGYFIQFGEYKGV